MSTPGDPPVDLADIDPPRCRHYTLAHVALRDLAFANPLAFMGVLASENARSFLSNLLDDITEHCKQDEPNPDFGIDEVIVHPTRIGKFPCAIIEMPRPRVCPETYFVAVVLLVDTAAELPQTDDLPMRYYTLEMGPDIDGASSPMFCEWTKEGMHSNFGGGPPAEVKLFAEAIADVLKA